MLTDFDIAVLFGVIATIGFCAVAGLISAIRQREEERTKNRLTLEWVHAGLIEPPEFDLSIVNPPPYLDGAPTIHWPMIWELEDDFSEPDPADLPARKRFQRSTRAETKAWGKRQEHPLSAATIAAVTSRLPKARVDLEAGTVVLSQ